MLQYNRSPQMLWANATCQHIFTPKSSNTASWSLVLCLDYDALVTLWHPLWVHQGRHICGRLLNVLNKLPKKDYLGFSFTCATKLFSICYIIENVFGFYTSKKLCLLDPSNLPNRQPDIALTVQ